MSSSVQNIVRILQDNNLPSLALEYVTQVNELVSSSDPVRNKLTQFITKFFLPHWLLALPKIRSEHTVIYKRAY